MSFLEQTPSSQYSSYDGMRAGNYGVPDDSKDDFDLMAHFESDNIQISALVVQNYAR